MDHLDLLNRLVGQVMSERQAKVYLALLQKGSATAAELQRSAGVPHSKIYEIVDSLVNQGYCRKRQVGNRRTFEPIDPKTAMISNIRQLKSRIEDLKTLTEHLLEIYNSTGRAAEPFEYIETLRGNEVIHQQYCQLVHNAKEEILGFGREPYAWDTSEKLKVQERELEGVLERGGISRWVFELRLPDHIPVLKYMNRLQKKGVRYRVADSLPLKMMIFDRQLLLLADERPGSIRGELTMSIIKNSTIVNAFIAHFEYIWDLAADYDQWKAANLELEMTNVL